MKNEKMFDALSNIDENITDGCIQRKTSADSAAPKQKKTAFYKILPAAVAVILIAAVALGTVGAVLYVKNMNVDKTPDANDGTARIVVKTDAAKINVGEDLPVSIYSVCGAKNEKTKGVTAKITMSYSRIDINNMIETVKVIDDGKDEGYTWNGSVEQLKSENVTVPAAVFTKADKTTDIKGLDKTDGVIVFSLEVNKTYEDGSEQKEQDSAALYYKIEDDEVYLKPSDETLELAGAAVEKLQEARALDASVLSIVRTLDEEYNLTAKWVAPELITLQTKKDAATALIKLYEELLTEYKTYNLDAYYDWMIKDCEYANEHAPYPVSEIKISEENQRIIDLQVTRRVIEALLALDCYYDMLKPAEIERMKKDFNEYVTVTNASAEKYFDDVSDETIFDSYRNGGFGVVITEN